MPKTCGATFTHARPIAPVTMLYWDSAAGDYVGQGRSEIYSPVNSQWFVSTQDFGASIQMEVRSLGDAEESRWTLIFRAAAGARLAPGTYAFGPAYDLNAASLDIFGNGRACSSPTGAFAIRALQVSGAAVPVFAVDFEHRCGPTAPALRGRLRINSTHPIVFEPRMADFDGDAQGRHGGVSPVRRHLVRPAVERPAPLRRPAASGALSGDLPVAGDYDGDGKVRTYPSSTLRPGGGLLRVEHQHGQVEPLRWEQKRATGRWPATTTATGRTDIGVYHPSTGEWCSPDWSSNGGA